MKPTGSKKDNLFTSEVKSDKLQAQVDKEELERLQGRVLELEDKLETVRALVSQDDDPAQIVQRIRELMGIEVFAHRSNSMDAESIGGVPVNQAPSKSGMHIESTTFNRDSRAEAISLEKLVTKASQEFS